VRQGQTYVSGPRNTQLWAVLLFGNLSVIPGQRALISEMHRRCGERSPYNAWAFVFHRSFEIVPDYVPVFVTRTSSGWYVF
jgi:hypothetical protein